MILLGTFMTDINLGIYTANLDPANCIYATSEQLRIRHHHFHGVLLADFIRGLTRPASRAPPRTAAAAARTRCDASSQLAADDADHDPAADRPAERVAGRHRSS